MKITLGAYEIDHAHHRGISSQPKLIPYFLPQKHSVGEKR